MTVIPTGAASVTPQLLRSMDAAQPSDGGQPDLSFAELLFPQWEGERGGLDASPLPAVTLPVEFRPDEPLLRIEASVAANAIRFDARPVFAPAEPAPDDPQAPALPALSRAPPRNGHEPIELPVNPDVAIGAESASLPSVARLSGPRGDGIAAVPLFPISRAAKSALAVPAAPAFGPSDSSQAVTRKISSAPALPISSASNDRRMPASIAVLPTEVVVTVQGLSLTEAEREVLQTSVQDLLAERGLGTRMIRIQFGARRTS